MASDQSSKTPPSHNADSGSEGTGSKGQPKGQSKRKEYVECDVRRVGVGPHPKPWPEDERFDVGLLAEGDRRNVIDQYRYWTLDAIVKDLDTKRHDFAVAVENWEHDFNIGTVVRNANAFGAHSVHIVGKRRWNRRGAMVTDKYQHVFHHSSVEELILWLKDRDMELIAIDNIGNSQPIEQVEIPRRSCLIFGQEGPGLTQSALELSTMTLEITQYGSTRSINAGVASGIAMYEWLRQHAPHSD